MDASVSEMVLLKNGGSLKQSRVEEFRVKRFRGKNS